VVEAKKGRDRLLDAEARQSKNHVNDYRMRKIVLQLKTMEKMLIFIRITTDETEVRPRP